MKEQIELENKTGKFKILGTDFDEVMGEVTLKKGKLGKLRIFAPIKRKNYFNSIDKKNNKIGTVTIVITALVRKLKIPKMPLVSLFGKPLRNSTSLSWMSSKDM